MAPPVYLACGHLTLDRGPGGDVPGGAVFYGGLAAAALGATVRVLAGAGPDFPPSALEGLPRLPGVEIRLVASPQTTVFENRYGPDGRRTQRVLAAAPPLRPADLPEGWRGADALHLAPVLGEVDPRAFLAAARPRPSGAVGLGLQGLVRTVGPDGRVAQPPWPRPGAPALEGQRVVFAGEDDLAGQGEDFVAWLASAFPVAVVTHGARGCEVFTGGRSRRVGAFPAREVDPTGAGDAFAAGYLVALAGGADEIEAARLGAAIASIAVEGRGAETLRLPGTGAEARARAARVPVPGPGSG